MIDRNIGLTERIVRLVLGVILIGCIFTADRFGAPQALALVAAFALVWNSIFARCYLWKWLRISTCDPARKDCAQPRSEN